MNIIQFGDFNFYDIDLTYKVPKFECCEPYTPIQGNTNADVIEIEADVIEIDADEASVPLKPLEVCPHMQFGSRDAPIRLDHLDDDFYEDGMIVTHVSASVKIIS